MELKLRWKQEIFFPRFERMPLLPLDNKQMEIVKIEMKKIEPYIDQVKRDLF